MEDQVEKAQYIKYQDLPVPSAQGISQNVIELGFESKQWFIQFQTITKLRSANRHYEAVFLKELLPLNYKHIINQVDNLRSNNSKQALTLLSQIIEYQNFQTVENDITRAIVASLLGKSVSQKGFLKNQALKGLNQLPKKWNIWALEELQAHTHSVNGQISQLSMRLVSQMISNKKQWEADDKFLKNLSSNLNGKRAVVQKHAREVLRDLKQRIGEEQLEKKICNSSELLEEQSNTLRRELKQKEQKAKGPSFKQFLKSKKMQG